MLSEEKDILQNTYDIIACKQFKTCKIVKYNALDMYICNHKEMIKQ